MIDITEIARDLLMLCPTKPLLLQEMVGFIRCRQSQAHLRTSLIEQQRATVSRLQKAGMFDGSWKAIIFCLTHHELMDIKV